jgi:hypothetical protein
VGGLFMAHFVDQRTTEDATDGVIRPFRAIVIEIDQGIFQIEAGDFFEWHDGFSFNCV